MATKKKYDNGVDSGKRFHYDVYEVNGDIANHIAPFSQEYEAIRVAEALAALDVLDEGVIHDSVYVVRARPTVAHNIHRQDAAKVKKNYRYLSELRKRMAEDLKVYFEPTKTAVGEDTPEAATEPESKPNKKFRKKIKA